MRSYFPTFATVRAAAAHVGARLAPYAVCAFAGAVYVLMLAGADMSDHAGTATAGAETVPVVRVSAPAPGALRDAPDGSGAKVTEDSPWWDCRIDGDRVCGERNSNHVPAGDYSGMPVWLFGPAR